MEDDLLTKEVTNLDGVTLTVDDDVDGKVSVDVAHLVLEAFGDANDHVVDQGADGANGGHVLAAAVVDGEPELVLGDELDFNVQVAQVLGEFATGALDGDDARLDVDGNALGNNKLVVFVNVLSWKCELSEIRQRKRRPMCVCTFMVQSS